MKFLDKWSMLNKYLLLSLFLVLFLRVIASGAYPLMDTTEARYAEIAREMVATNNWITPQLDPGAPFWAKPPLSTWATAISFKLFGVSEFTARLSSVMFAIATLFLIFIFSRKLGGITFALKASLILATTGLFYFMAGGVMTDPALGFTVSLSMVSFYLALESELEKAKLIWSSCFFIGLGLSLLAKGPVGIVLTLFPLFLWVTVAKKWSNMFSSLHFGKGILIALAIASPWYILAEIKTPGFSEYYFIGEHFKRFVVPGWKGDLFGNAHSQPRGMIWLFVIPTTVPWCILFLGNLYPIIANKKFGKFLLEEKFVLYLIFWFLAPMIFFTFAGNILMTYVFPAIPAFAVLTTYLVETNKNIYLYKRWYTSVKVFFFFAFFVPVIFSLVAFFMLPKIGLRRSHKEIAQLILSKGVANSRIVYPNKMPYSADFYSGGIACELKKSLDEAEMKQYLNDDIFDFYVVKEEALEHFNNSFGRFTKRQDSLNKCIIFTDKNQKDL